MSWRGKSPSKETRELMSKNRTGKKLNLSKEEQARRGKQLTDYNKSEEHRRIASETGKKRKGKRSHKIGVRQSYKTVINKIEKNQLSILTDFDLTKFGYQTKGKCKNGTQCWWSTLKRRRSYHTKCNILINCYFHGAVLHHLNYKKGICGWVSEKVHRSFPHKQTEPNSKNFEILNSIAWAEQFIQRREVMEQ